MINELKYSEIAFSYKKEVLQDTSDESLPIIGQTRALSALSLGMSMMRHGYNIFLSGEFGTGKLTAVKQEAEKNIHDLSYMADVVYLANLENPDSPLCLCFERGKGKLFKDDLSKLYTTKDFNSMKEQYPNARAFLTKLERANADELCYEANLAIDRGTSEKRPFIIENHPSFENLFGYYDTKAKMPHLGIKTGSYEQASGGYLVLTADELLSVPLLWEALKRHLDTSSMAIKGSVVKDEIGKGGKIRPQAIALPTKVILLGSDDIYDELSDKDEQFLRLFRIAPQFDYLMKANDENIRGTVAFIKREANNLITEDAILELLRYSSWFTESRDELSTQLVVIGDLLSEAEFYKTKDGRKLIETEDVLKAIKEREYAASITEDRINHEISDGELIISLTGKKVGVVNGLAVMDRGPASFGTPTVISVTVAPGSEGIVNIEHEAGLSGEIHDKGVLILEGFLRMRYARSFPLSIYAGICFEQNYAEIDGDSASSSELYALLSAIGEIPIRQDIGLTGSVNQMGVIQPVGGINEKIFGFYKACKNQGLTGKQGVIIPYLNMQALILDHEVEEAIKNNLFHIWAVKTIEEGMELLSELPRGERDRRGVFSNGSFNRIIEDKLKALYMAGSAKN